MSKKRKHGKKKSNKKSGTNFLKTDIRNKDYYHNDMLRLQEKRISEIMRLAVIENLILEEDMEYLEERYDNGEFEEELEILNAGKNEFELAQDKIFESINSNSKIKIAKAIEALEITKLCSDAYNILAEEQAKTGEEKKEFYKKGVIAGENYIELKNIKFTGSNLPDDYLLKPFYRSLIGLAFIQWELGEFYESIESLKKLLNYDVQDNFSVKFLIVFKLISIAKFEEAQKIIDDYDGEINLEVLLAETILSIINSGMSEKTKELFEVLFNFDSSIIPYITGFSELSDDFPEFEKSEETEGLLIAYQSYEVFTVLPILYSYFARLYLEFIQEQKIAEEIPSKDLISQIKKAVEGLKKYTENPEYIKKDILELKEELNLNKYNSEL